VSEAATILIIDDEDSVADMVADALRDEGYRVLVAYDGRRGLEMARQNQPTLILSDVMMPFMDGVKMAQMLHSEFGSATPPLVFMSAVDCRNQTQPYGSFLAKPFTLDALFTLIENILEH
jgi:DNA-binding response OmpR family regulator